MLIFLTAHAHPHSARYSSLRADILSLSLSLSLTHTHTHTHTHAHTHTHTHRLQPPPSRQPLLFFMCTCLALAFTYFALMTAAPVALDAVAGATGHIFDVVGVSDAAR